MHCLGEASSFFFSPGMCSKVGVGSDRRSNLKLAAIPCKKFFNECKKPFKLLEKKAAKLPFRSCKKENKNISGPITTFPSSFSFLFSKLREITLRRYSN